MPTDAIQDQLKSYLSDAHSIEEQALPQMQAAPKIAGDPIEHLEIGGYEQLRVVAQRADDDATVTTVERILESERSTADRIVSHFDRALDASLASQGIAAQGIAA